MYAFPPVGFPQFTIYATDEANKVQPGRVWTIACSAGSTILYRVYIGVI